VIHTSTAQNRRFLHFVTIARSPHSSVAKRPFGDIFRQITPISLNIAPPTVDIQTGFPYNFLPGGDTVSFKGLLSYNIHALVSLGSDYEGSEEEIIPDDVDLMVSGHQRYKVPRNGGRAIREARGCGRWRCNRHARTRTQNPWRGLDTRS
jgi:hypothetical protein